MIKENIKRKLAQRGFTLIELLIVIAIVGILAALIFSNFVGVRQRARDSQRKSDLRQIQTALELYRADQGTYPSVIYDQSTCASSGPLKSPDLSVTYMSKVPCNPSYFSTVNSPNTGKYVYSYSSSANTYTLDICIENTNDADPNVMAFPVYCPASSSNKNYRLTNP